MEVSRKVHALADVPPSERAPLPIGYDIGWATDPVCTHWTKTKQLFPCRESKRNSTVVQLMD